eukprot:gb/GECG01009621.1/.p1 GENE.gb/GECG01009621.1/~~gb/GECG01009621.1/.p1  ORF type:complete len:147 (+),score=12.69 gb/GECG01009621.1/:1-441(+)
MCWREHHKNRETRKRYVCISGGSDTRERILYCSRRDRRCKTIQAVELDIAALQRNHTSIETWEPINGKSFMLDKVLPDALNESEVTSENNFVPDIGLIHTLTLPSSTPSSTSTSTSSGSASAITTASSANCATASPFNTFTFCYED